LSCCKTSPPYRLHMYKSLRNNPRKLPAVHDVILDPAAAASQFSCCYCLSPEDTHEYAHACWLHGSAFEVSLIACQRSWPKMLPAVVNYKLLSLMCTESAHSICSMPSHPVGCASLLCCGTPPELLDSLCNARALEIEPHQSQKSNAGRCKCCKPRTTQHTLWNIVRQHRIDGLM